MEKAMSEKARFIRFDDQTWPVVDTDLAWTLRYAYKGGALTLDNRDRLYLASILDAYEELIRASTKRREAVCRTLRKKNGAAVQAED
jgi:hypothetical protein